MKGVLTLGAAYLGLAVLICAVGMAILDAMDRAADGLDQPTTATIAPTAVDYRVCFPVQQPPLLDQPQGNYDYRLGRGRRDGGAS